MLPCFVAQYSGCQLRTIRKSLTSRTQVYKPHSKKARIWICNRGERGGGHLLCWPPCPKEIAQHRGKRRPPFQAADSRFEVDLRRKEHYEAIDWHPVPAKELNLMLFFFRAGHLPNLHRVQTEAFNIACCVTCLFYSFFICVYFYHKIYTKGQDYIHGQLFVR